MSRSMDQGNPGRRNMGTPHTVFSAFCAALATPRAPRKVRMMPMTRAGPVCIQPVHVVLQLRADHRELAERGVEHLVLEGGVAAQHDVQHGDQHQQQREQRGETVVGDQRGQVAGLVVAELLPHRDREGQPGPVLLGLVHPVDQPLNCVHVPVRTQQA